MPDQEPHCNVDLAFDHRRFGSGLLQADGPKQRTEEQRCQRQKGEPRCRSPPKKVSRQAVHLEIEFTSTPWDSKQYCNNISLTPTLLGVLTCENSERKQKHNPEIVFSSRAGASSSSLSCFEGVD